LRRVPTKNSVQQQQVESFGHQGEETDVCMASEDARKLFVAGLPDTITEDILRQLFEATGGTVVEVSIPRDRATGRPRGFGFVSMSTQDEAASARDSLDGSLQAGKSISVRPFQAEPPRKDAVGPGGVRSPLQSAVPFQAAPDRTLYVGNLPYDCSQEEIETLIQGTGAGPIARVNLPMDPDGRKRGFGFVTMETPEAARAAMEALRGADLRGRRLVINIAHPKGERPARTDQPVGGPALRSVPSFDRNGPPRTGDRPFRSAGPAYPMPSPDQMPARKTFDERKRAPKPDATVDGAGRRRAKWDRDRDTKDWEDYDDDE
jgi:RNA recognition motif-containing protein